MEPAEAKLHPVRFLSASGPQARHPAPCFDRQPIEAQTERRRRQQTDRKGVVPQHKDTDLLREHLQR
ncbi:hypothetical protein INR49_008449 [Caranx melampygus]|nr:hypothetical protein INR49_008449 [Caranx melampygus]